MTAPAAAALINLLGHITGSVLYAMLLVMALRRQKLATSIGTGGVRSEKTDRLPLLTALLGLAWNLGALTALVTQSFANVRPLPLLMATAFTSLGFLPAVVVHSLMRTGDGWRRRPLALAMTVVAYGLGSTAGALHFQQAIVRGNAPSQWALRVLTVGFAALIVALLFTVRRQNGWQRAVWVSALALFAVSALHLSHHEGRYYSFTRDGNGSGGFGYFGKGWFSADFSYDNRKYGIPFDTSEEEPEIVFLTPRRASFQAKGGYRDLDSFISGGNFSFQYNNYKHDEVAADTGSVNTAFNNDTYLYRGVFEERRTGRFSGSMGFWGMHRDYESVGEEALAPPTTQNAFALFGLQTIDFKRAALQFGGRFEHNGYNPTGLSGLPQRSFNGFSGAAGFRVPIGGGTAFVANYTHSYRAPALEELYNNGPRPGNATFEIGDPNLGRESSDGIDMGLRHSSDRLQAEANFFYYHINNFIFLAPTGDIDDGLPVANYARATAGSSGRRRGWTSG